MHRRFDSTSETSPECALRTRPFCAEPQQTQIRLHQGPNSRHAAGGRHYAYQPAPTDPVEGCRIQNKVWYAAEVILEPRSVQLSFRLLLQSAICTILRTVKLC